MEFFCFEKMKAKIIERKIPSILNKKKPQLDLVLEKALYLNEVLS